MIALVLVEHEGGAVKDATLAAVTAAGKLGAVHALVAGGADAAGVADAVAKIAGVEKVLLAADPAYAHMLPENVAPLAAQAMADYDAFVAPATTTGKNVAPRVAALLDVMQLSEVIGIEGERTFVRPIYAGNAIATVESSDAKLVLTVRGTAFDKASAEGGAAPIAAIAGPGDAGQSAFVSLDASKSERPELTSAGIIVSGGRALKDAATFEQVGADGDIGKSSFVSAEASESERPELTSAKVIVSGGRAFGSSEQFHSLLDPLADKLGAAVGASRAAVDAGYAPNDYQVGQTGKIVAPELYIAIGISGAIQHLAGMKDAKTIVAINKDEEAPIFQVADIGLVGDLFKIVPDLTEKL